MIDTRILKPPESKYTISGYLACPIDLYESLQYQFAAQIAYLQFPEVLFCEPATKDWNTERWLAEWEIILPKLEILFCILRNDKTIGKGCWKEIIDGCSVGIPIYIFDHDNKKFAPFKKVIRLPFIKRSFPYYARVYFHALSEGIGTDAKESSA